MATTVAASAAALAALIGVAAPAVAAPDFSVGRTSDSWAPVAKLQAKERGPQPGTQCTQRGEVREYVELRDSHFDVEGRQSSVNETEGVVPLKQTIKESKKKKWTWSASVTVKLTNEIKKKYDWEYNREMFWSLGQNLGPYDLMPGEKGTLAWGFIMDDYTSQRVRCGAAMTWEPVGRQNHGSAPRERHVEVVITKAS
ncbi:hypothetical protein H7347_05520 [Corynebacterium sp. zg-331]|nr:hypothetical protein [Corynebacterium sp. zg-331]MPV52528.1 hypothetical protein [Corynebacterium sp. zg331]